MEDRPKSDSIDLSRRAFVATTSATAVGWTLVRPRSVRGSSANSKIQVGCIGLGGRGRWIAGLFRQHGGYTVAAVADYFPKVAKREGTKLGLPEAKCFSGLLGYQRVLDAGVDALVLETPPYCFATHASAAIESGRHVYMAKPVAIDVPGALAIRKAGRRATENGLVLLVDLQLRVDPYLQECIRRVRAGAMGPMQFIRAFYDDEGRADPPLTGNWADRFQHLIWTMNVCLGGGRIVAAGIHAIDAMIWLAGETPESCVGAGRRCRANPHGDSYDAYSLTYKFPSGLIANYSGDQFRNFHSFNCGCDAYGWQSYLETRYGGKTWMRGADWRYEGGEKKDLYPYGAKTNIDVFHQSIQEKVATNPTVESSVNANLTAILGREAAHRGATVTWDAMMQEAKSLAPDLSGLVQ